MAQTNELLELLNSRIPRARQDLRDSHKNLEGLAEYCERNYVEAQTKESLANTKQYAAQSLASVAYQVNVLATNLLELLDRQTKHMVQMESNVRHISEVQRSSPAARVCACVWVAGDVCLKIVTKSSTLGKCMGGKDRWSV